MDIEVESWDPETFPNSKLMGRAKVILNKKMYLWLDIIAGKNGHAFCTFPSFKNKQEKYTVRLGWIDNDTIQKDIQFQVLKILKERYSL